MLSSGSIQDPRGRSGVTRGFLSISTSLMGRPTHLHCLQAFIRSPEDPIYARTVKVCSTWGQHSSRDAGSLRACVESRMLMPTVTPDVVRVGGKTIIFCQSWESVPTESGVGQFPFARTPGNTSSTLDASVHSGLLESHRAEQTEDTRKTLAGTKCFRGIGCKRLQQAARATC